MSKQTKFKIGDKVRRTSHLANGTHTYGTVDTVVGIVIAGKKEWIITKNNGFANCDADNYELVERAEEQREDAMMALDTLAEWANKCMDFYPKGKTVPDISSLRQIVCTHLQAPPVPVIEGLEEAIERGSNPQMTGNEALDLFERGDFAKIIKAARAYSKLQKGEQNGHDQS